MRTVLLIALAALTACTSYAHIARTNAPGVVDISTPYVHETGADDLYEQPAYDQPGSDAIVAWLHPAFGGGLVRHGAGYELSVGVSIEKDHADGNDGPFARNAWGASVGMGILQGHTQPGSTETVTETPGPFWIEAYRRRFIVTYGAGAVVYPDTRDVGVQITVHAPLTHIRARWVQTSGFEVMFAWDLNFPLVFGWSR